MHHQASIIFVFTLFRFSNPLFRLSVFQTVSVPRRTLFYCFCLGGVSFTNYMYKYSVCIYNAIYTVWFGLLQYPSDTASPSSPHCYTTHILSSSLLMLNEDSAIPHVAHMYMFVVPLFLNELKLTSLLSLHYIST